MKKKIRVRVSMDDKGTVHVTKVVRDRDMLIFALWNLILAIMEAAMAASSAIDGSFRGAYMCGLFSVLLLGFALAYFRAWKKSARDVHGNTWKAA
ncbi:hypothetical protein [Bifidobacterium sp.]|uniref:hypothetical protein n=1 Tax=Bifidobacterium sp. TaxID=41200 RepID=UPI0039E9330D